MTNTYTTIQKLSQWKFVNIKKKYLTLTQRYIYLIEKTVKKNNQKPVWWDPLEIILMRLFGVQYIFVHFFVDTMIKILGSWWINCFDKCNASLLNKHNTKSIHWKFLNGSVCLWNNTVRSKLQPLNKKETISKQWHWI